MFARLAGQLRHIRSPDPAAARTLVHGGDRPAGPRPQRPPPARKRNDKFFCLLHAKIPVLFNTFDKFQLKNS